MMATDDDSKNVLFQYVSDKRAFYWDQKKSGMSHFKLVSTSIKTQMKKQRIHYTYEAEELLTDYYSCLKKSDAKHCQTEGIDDNAKLSVPVYVYEEIAKDLLSSGEIIWWAFMILQWNLMARSINVEQIHVEFFGWSGDMMTCLFAHTKTMKGDRTKMKPFHLSTNQQRPWICPVTAVAILLMSGFHSTKQLFEAGSAAKSYNRAIKIALKSPSVQTAMKRAGVKEKDVASHTFRKSSATHVSGNSLCTPSIFSILLRGGWSIGEVMSKYIHVGEAQDRFLAHLLAGRDLFETSFHYVCPHFITLPSDDILKGTLFIKYKYFLFISLTSIFVFFVFCSLHVYKHLVAFCLEANEEKFQSMRSLLVMLLASAVSAFNNDEFKDLLTKNESNSSYNSPQILSNSALYGQSHLQLTSMLAKGKQLTASDVIKCSGKHPTAFLIQQIKCITEQVC